MTWLEPFQKIHPWLERQGPSTDVVISSRIRLARNLTAIPFPARLDKGGQRDVVDRVLIGARNTPTLRKAQFVDLTTTKKLERQFLMERHLISPEMAFDDDERGILVEEGQQLIVMINEEDHLRLQCFEPGLSLSTAYGRANTLDNELGQHLPYAYDSEWGFCTRCPTNAGTGLRASCLLHVPALAMSEEIERVLESLSELGVTSRGFYGEKSRALGDLFQISNATSLGQPEDEIVANMERVVQTVVHYERQSRESLLEPKRRPTTEDIVYRSYGILLHARAISYDEAMVLLSRVRLGVQLGFELPTTAAMLNELMIATQPAHLQLLNGNPLKTEERDRLRAKFIRTKLSVSSRGPGNATE